MENLIAGLEVTVIGMGMVFLILIMLFISLLVMKKVFAFKTGSTAQSPETASSPTKSLDSTLEEETEIIAVLAAAVAAAESSKKPVRVTSIRHVSTTQSEWALAGRIDKLGDH